MAHASLTIVTMICVALHAMLGCCAHHVHCAAPQIASSPQRLNESSETSASHCGCQHHHDRVDAPEAPPHQPHHRDDCTEQSCNFASPDHSDTLELLRITATGVASTSNVSSHSANPLQPVWRWTLQRQAIATDRARGCAQTQIWQL